MLVSVAFSGHSSSPASQAHVRQSGRKGHSEAELVGCCCSGLGHQCSCCGSGHVSGRSPAEDENSCSQGPGLTNTCSQWNQVCGHWQGWSSLNEKMACLTGCAGLSAGRITFVFMTLEKSISGKDCLAECSLPRRHAWSGSCLSAGSRTLSCRRWPSPTWRPTWTGCSR